MTLETILQDLRNQRNKLDAAIKALEGVTTMDGAVRPQRKSRVTRRKRGPMSAAAKRKLSRLMKARWAQRKAGAKK